MSASRREAYLAALEHCRCARRAEAEALLDALIGQYPDDSQSLLLLATLRMEKSPREAEALLQRCLALAPENSFALHYLGKVKDLQADHVAAIELFRRAAAANPKFAPTFNDLGASLHQVGERDQALAAFERAIAIDPNYTTAHSNRGLLLAEMRRADESRAAFRDVLASAQHSADAWQNFGAAHFNLGEFEQAVDACRKALSLDPGHLGAYATLAQALARLHRTEEAERVRAEWARRQGVVVTACRKAQPDARVLLIGAAEFCNVPTQDLFDRDWFETISINLLPPGEAGDDPATRVGQLPDFDVAFNAVGDADRGDPYFGPALDLCNRLGRPVLNPPNRIARTRRDRLPLLLADIPGLATPAIRRVTPADLTALAADPQAARWPILLRPIGSHGGDDLQHFDGPEGIAAYLEAVPADEYYLSDFWDFRSQDGHFRKYRLIFVDRQVFPYHLAITDKWLVHYWRAEMADWMKREEEAFLADFRNAFRGPAADAVLEVARRLDLDFAGMDCTILPDGRVLVFEANATMLVHLRESREAFAYKHAHVPRIIDAMADLVRRKSGGAAGARAARPAAA